MQARQLKLGACYFEPDELLDGDPRREELLRTVPLLMCTDGITDGKKLTQSLFLVVATARGGPEQFYLPGELARALHRPWKPEDMWNALAPIMRAERAMRKPAVASPSWREPEEFRGRALGSIPNAEEALTKALVPRNLKKGEKARFRSYEESDSPGVAAKVRELGLLGTPEGTSQSFTCFVEKLRRLSLSPPAAP